MRSASEYHNVANVSWGDHLVFGDDDFLTHLTGESGLKIAHPQGFSDTNYAPVVQTDSVELYMARQ